MTLVELLAAFREGRVMAPSGVVRPEAVRITRGSLLVMTRGTVLKLRRPREIGEWNQTSDPLRAVLSARERLIGTRIAPHLFLDPVQLMTADDGSLSLAVATEGGESVIAMHRQPDELRADQVILTREPPREAFTALMLAIARFHDNADAHWADDGPGDPGRALASWTAAIEMLAADPDLPVGAAELAGLDADTRDLLTRIERPLAHRVLEGRMREGHGGLALRHVFLTDPPSVIDAADFTEDTCFFDTAEDIAHLVLELRAVTSDAFADRIVDAYAGAARDHTLRRVLPFYLRLAAIRAAQDALDTARDPEGAADPAECHAAARFFLARASAEG